MGGMNMKTIQQNSSLGDIVAAYPRTAALFQTLKIDYCCGGDRTLRAAVEEQGLSLESVWPSIQTMIDQTADQDEVNPADLALAELAAWIEERHHAYLRNQLPAAGAYLFKILTVHGANHPELFTVHRLFSRLKAELEQHLVKEEVRLFPDPADQTDLIEELKAEHEKAGSLLHEIRHETRDFAVPADGCQTYELTYATLADLESDLFQHILLENNLLFPRLAAQKS
jgi:regulator of cell morphogenesis and NO signaling